MTRHLLAISILLASLLGIQLTTATAEARHGLCGGCGTVVDVDRIYYDRGGDRGAEGAILGAIIGGALGNQVGDGSGRRAATVGGAVAGALIGRKADRRGRGRGERGLRLEVRMDGGGYRVVEVHGDMRIYRGDRVRLRRDRVVLLHY